MGLKEVHTKVGGITDASCRFFVIWRIWQIPGGDRELRILDRPARDARSILKLARPGIKDVGQDRLPFEAATGTVYVSPGVMSCAGIIPYPKHPGEFQKFAPQVLTKYGRALWVKRAFEAKEILMAGDVPETFIHLAATLQEMDCLIDVLDWPSKMLQVVAEGVEGILDKDPKGAGSGTKRNRKAGSIEGFNLEVNQMRLKNLGGDESRDVYDSRNGSKMDSGREDPSLEDDYTTKKKR
jgi:hypothetical protein